MCGYVHMSAGHLRGHYQVAMDASQEGTRSRDKLLLSNRELEKAVGNVGTVLGESGDHFHDETWRRWGRNVYTEYRRERWNYMGQGKFCDMWTDLHERVLGRFRTGVG